MTIGSTWARTYDFRATRLHHPKTLDELRQIVAATPRIRALGTRHSFNDVADSSELVSLVDRDPHYDLDTEKLTVTVAAGTRYGVLAGWLNARGYALHNMGSLPHISIAGAISTGTHGSGNGNGSLSTAVSGIQLVTSAGDVVELDRQLPGFDGMVVSLGALGIITRVTLDIQPSYQVRQDVYRKLSWDAVLADVEGVTGSAYSVSLFTNWLGDTLDQAWLKTRLVDGMPTELPDTFFGGQRAGSTTAIISERDDNTTVQGGIPGPWSERLPHFRADSTPSSGDEIQSEYFVDRADASRALGALRELGTDIAPLLIVTELRTTAPDSLWLSPAYQRPSLAIHFTWKNEPAKVLALLPRIERALAPFDARPHWGKVFTRTADQLTPLYERASDFAALVREFDPAGKFRNAYLNRVLGL